MINKNFCLFPTDKNISLLVSDPLEMSNNLTLKNVDIAI